MIEIQTFILEKLQELFSVNITEDLYDESFFSTKIGLEARNAIDLVYLLEKEFNIYFEENILFSPKFLTFNGMVEEIKKYILIN